MWHTLLALLLELLRAHLFALGQRRLAAVALALVRARVRVRVRVRVRGKVRALPPSPLPWCSTLVM